MADTQGMLVVKVYNKDTDDCCNSSLARLPDPQPTDTINGTETISFHTAGLEEISALAQTHWLYLRRGQEKGKGKKKKIEDRHEK